MPRPIAILLVLCCSSSAFAWNPKGHRIIAEVAERQLAKSSPESLKQVLDILGTAHLADVAALPDEWAPQPGTWHTAPWHFVNIPLKGSFYDADRDCPHSACLVGALLPLYSLLSDPKVDRRQRREAMIYFIHLMGDIFEGWRCSDSGTDIHVTYKGGHVPGNRTGDPKNDNLFFVWEVSLLQYEGLFEAPMIKHLFEKTLDNRDPEKLHLGTFSTMAEENHKVAQDSQVKDGTNLDDAYMKTNADAMDEQLLEAGLNLAYKMKCAFPAQGKLPCQ